MVNGPDQIFIERRGVLTKAEIRFEDENQLLETIRRMVATTGRHIDGLNPMVDARLPDGSRVNAIIRPAAIHGPALTIRKFKDAVLGIEDLKHEGSLSPAMAEFLQAAVLGRMNIVVSGGTGSGKTTTLNVIARFIPHNQRVITIEDAAELQIDHPHVIALEHRPPNVEGKGELTIRQLLRNSLRMRPDRILVGEVRGAEALDMLQAMNTGHDGSMSTIHSNSARDALSRLETMVMMASIDIPFEAVRAQIASAVNLIVHQARMPDGRRKVAQIAEVVGYDSNGAVLRDIFLLGMGPDLRLEYNATGYVPTALDKAAFYGVQVNQDLFDPVKSRFIPAGSDSMMPVVKDPLLAGAGKTENVVRQVFVVPFSSDRGASGDGDGRRGCRPAGDRADPGDAGRDAQADRRRPNGRHRPAGRGARARRRGTAGRADRVPGGTASGAWGGADVSGAGRVRPRRRRARPAGPGGGDRDGPRDHRPGPAGGRLQRFQRHAAHGHGQGGRARPGRRLAPHTGRDREHHHPPRSQPSSRPGADRDVRGRGAQGERLRQREQDQQGLGRA